MVKKLPPRQLGTTTAITGAVDTPRVTLNPEKQFPQQTAFPELQNVTIDNSQVRAGSEATNDKAMGNIRQEGNNFFIGDKPVSRKEYETARELLKSTAMGIPQPTTARQAGAAMGLDPFASDMQRQAEREALVQRIGAEPQAQAIDPATGQPMQQQGQVTPIDAQQALYTGVLDGIIGGAGIATLKAVFGATAIAGATAGAKAGTLAGPKGILIGAAAGFAGGMVTGIVKSIRQQRTDNLKAQQQVLTDGQRNVNQLISLMNLDPDNAHMYVEALNEQMTNIAQAHSQLKLDTQSNLNLALSKDGTRELQRFANFYSAGGAYDILTTKAQIALAAPNPEEGMRGLLASSQSIAMEE
jgi:hypothetical protein